MHFAEMRLIGIRCFEDTGAITLDPHCNVFIGANNAGKTTLLKAALSWQQHQAIDGNDLRIGSVTSYITTHFRRVPLKDLAVSISASEVRIAKNYIGTAPHDHSVHNVDLGASNVVFHNTRPRNQIVPFLAKRKVATFDHNVAAGKQSDVTGTFSELYSRIDLLSTFGHPAHDKYVKTVRDVVGLDITTRASSGGKEAGYYFNEQSFITLERMGDGVSEMVALIVDLCLERGKVFLVEEPETNLHPAALKSLLGLIRDASETNQFIISTHSNLVVRELGGKLFKVSREDGPQGRSVVEEVERTPSAHLAVLNELGYGFTDLSLPEGWLFLE